ncbi:hypothetical protein QJQ45_010314 [Haematococcus lacustris]|nr:hypothetical protein QJQ45_010314 [Haematococcus lacustris]
MYVGASGSGQQEVVGERRQVIKAAIRGLVEAALPDLSSAQVDAVVAEVNKRMTMGSKQCCLTAVLSLSMLLQSFLSLLQLMPTTQPKICNARLTSTMTAVELMVAAQQWSAITRAMPTAKPSIKPAAATADGPTIRKRGRPLGSRNKPKPPAAQATPTPTRKQARDLVHLCSPRSAAAPAQLPPPVQLNILDPKLLAQIKDAMELLTTARVLKHLLRGPHHSGIKLLPTEVAVFEQPSSAWPVAMLQQLDEVHLTGDGNSLNANATTIITSINEPSQLDALLAEYSDVFTPLTGLPPDRPVGHTIPLEPGNRPPATPMYRLNKPEHDELKQQIQDFLAKGMIEPSSSPYAAPVLFGQKKSGELRMCIDYRQLNKITLRDQYPLPHIDDLFDKLSGCKVFSSLDLQAGYHQIRITPEDVPKTAFRTPEGHFQFRVLCFGLTNAPATFQRVMNDAFATVLGKCALVYLDDILVMSRRQAKLSLEGGGAREAGLRAAAPAAISAKSPLALSQFEKDTTCVEAMLDPIGSETPVTQDETAQYPAAPAAPMGLSDQLNLGYQQDPAFTAEADHSGMYQDTDGLWRISGKAGEYLVQWEGYDASFNTWEPRANLTGCDKLLAEYNAIHCLK